MAKRAGINTRGIDDYHSLRDLARGGQLGVDMLNFIDELEGTAAAKTILDGYTNTGAPRVKEYNMKNVIGAMKRIIRENGGVSGAEGGLGSGGIGNLRSRLAKPLKDMPSVKRESIWLGAEPLDVAKYIDKLGEWSGEKIDNLPIQELNHRLFTKITDKALSGERINALDELSDNPFEAQRYFDNMLTDIQYHKTHNPAIYNSLLKDVEGDMDVFKGILSSQPTEYFEAKPTRSVGFNEFEGAIIPSNNIEIKDLLIRLGIPTLGQYEDGIGAAFSNAGGRRISPLMRAIKQLINEKKIPTYAIAAALGGIPLTSGGLAAGQLASNQTDSH
jgi:hypothetical protein